MSGERKLDASYAALQVQLGAHHHAKQTALRTTVRADFLIQLGLAALVGEVARDRRTHILEHFERAGRQIRRQGLVDLVSAFEADLFRLLRIATSRTRHLLDRHYDAADPFAAHRGDLVRTTDDVSNLGGYRRWLAARSGSRADPRRDLWDVVAYRDFLAHGERWDCPAAPPGIAFAYRTLSNELDRVGPAR